MGVSVPHSIFLLLRRSPKCRDDPFCVLLQAPNATPDHSVSVFSSDACFESTGVFVSCYVRFLDHVVTYHIGSQWDLATAQAQFRANPDRSCIELAPAEVSLVSDAIRALDDSGGDTLFSGLVREYLAPGIREPGQTSTPMAGLSPAGTYVNAAPLAGAENQAMDDGLTTHTPLGDVHAAPQHELPDLDTLVEFDVHSAATAFLEHDLSPAFASATEVVRHATAEAHASFPGFANACRGLERAYSDISSGLAPDPCYRDHVAPILAFNGAIERLGDSMKLWVERWSEEPRAPDSRALARFFWCMDAFGGLHSHARIIAQRSAEWRHPAILARATCSLAKLREFGDQMWPALHLEIETLLLFSGV